MRAVALHPDVIVVTSRVWQTTCTVVRGPGGDGATGEAFVIDSPVYPDELELLPTLLEQASFPLSGLLATHGDWDHLLGRLAFPGAALGCAQSTAERLRAEPGAAQRALRDFDDEHYVERERPLALGEVQALPVPGRLEVGDGELQLQPAVGHTPDGMAIWASWASVLVVGDYLSPVEIPSLAEGGSPEDYAATLQRLRPMVTEAEHVVPGHGPPLASAQALQILEADLSYLEDLAARGAHADLPRAPRSRLQRQRHAENVAVVRAAE